MKRRELLRRLARQARSEGLELVAIEGGSHTKVRIADGQSTVPRHSEINEITAKAILKHMGVQQ